MKAIKDKLIGLYKLAMADANRNLGVVVDYVAFLEAISGRTQTPAVKVKAISVSSKNEN